MALYTPEPGIWICLAIKFAAAIQSEGFSSNSSSVISAGFMADGVLSMILSNFYEMWHLHMGLISESLQVSGVVDARFLLKTFFDKLISHCQPLHWGLLDIFNGITYFPLERSLYLKTHVSLLQSCTIFSYSNAFRVFLAVWSVPFQKLVAAFFSMKII